jgi:uncharacterized protein (TIRG00374 family)
VGGGQTAGKRSKASFALRLAVSVILLGLLLWLVDWRASLKTLAGIRLSLVGLLLAISFTMIYVSCLKWQLFLRSRGQAVPIWQLIRLYLVGYFFNNFMPGNVGGDVVRGFALGREIRNRSDSLGTVFLERFTGFIALIAAALIAAGVNPGVVRTPGLGVFLAVMAATLVAMVSFLVSRPAQERLLRVVPRLPWPRVAKKLERFLDVVFFFHDKPRILGQAMAYSAAFHVLTVVNTYFICVALRLHAAFLDLAVLVPMVLLVSAVPLTLNAIGVMEGGFVYFLGMAGLSPAEALSVSLVLRAKNLIVTQIGALLYVRLPRERAEERSRESEPVRT